jgi:hypothetical protein
VSEESKGPSVKRFSARLLVWRLSPRICGRDVTASVACDHCSLIQKAARSFIDREVNFFLTNFLR